MATKIQLRRGTASQWTSANPVLSIGEIGFEQNTNKFKIGDGTTAWANLSYFGGEVDLSGYLTQSSASSTYLTQASASTNYLTRSSASTTYLTQASASTTYATTTSPTFTGTVTLPSNVKFENGANDLTIGSFSGKNKSVVFGYNAGSSLPQSGNADDVVAIGYRAMSGNNWGQYSVAVGSDALLGSGNQGSFNTGIGGKALAAIGSAGSLVQNVSNTAIGYNAGSAISSGGKNVIIGSNTGSTIDGLSNNIIISDGDGNIRAQYLSANSGWTVAAPASTSAVRNITLSTSAPSGGNDGDVWMVYI